MEIHPLIIQFGGSLIAIFALFLFARWLKLGGKPKLSTEEGARIAAGEVIAGFEASSSALDDSGNAALVRDASGRIVLIKRHGNKFAGRLLDGRANADAWRDSHPEGRRRPRVNVDSGDALFGEVTLFTEEAEAWAEAINAL